MSFASLCAFTSAYPVSFFSKCHAKNRKEVLAVRTSYRKEVLALSSSSRKEVLAVSRTQAQATHNHPQEERKKKFLGVHYFWAVLYLNHFLHITPAKSKVCCNVMLTCPCVS